MGAVSASLNTLSDAFDALSTALSNALDALGDAFVAGFDGIKTAFTAGFTNLTGAFNLLKDSFIDGFSSMVGGLSDVWNSVKVLPVQIRDLFSSLLTSLFVPQNFDFGAEIRSRLLFIDIMQSTMSNLSRSGEPLELATTYMGHRQVFASTVWFEPYRTEIRAGLSVVFWLSLFLALWRMLSNLFGMSVGGATRLEYRSDVQDMRRRE